MLERLLLLLQHLQLGSIVPEEVRAIVVDNYPDGRARVLCEHASGKLPIELFFVEEPQQGQSFARNRAIHEALRRDADLIAFIDDDDLPEPDWLTHLIEKHQQAQADIVYGTERQLMHSDWPAWLRELPLFQKKNLEGLNEFGAPLGLSSNNVLLGRSIIEKVRSTTGLIFSSEFNRLKCEDTEFFIRAVRCGATFARAGKSVINRDFEPHRLTARGVLKEAKRLGTYNMVLLKRYGDTGQASRRRTKAVAKTASCLLKLPFCAFSKASLMRDLFYLTRELAAVRTYHAKNIS